MNLTELALPSIEDKIKSHLVIRGLNPGKKYVCYLDNYIVEYIEYGNMPYNLRIYSRDTNFMLREEEYPIKKFGSSSYSYLYNELDIAHGTNRFSTPFCFYSIDRREGYDIFIELLTRIYKHNKDLFGGERRRSSVI